MAAERDGGGRFGIDAHGGAAAAGNTAGRVEDAGQSAGIGRVRGAGARWSRALFAAVTGLGDLIRIREESRAISDPFELADFVLRELPVELRATLRESGSGHQGP